MNKIRSFFPVVVFVVLASALGGPLPAKAEIPVVHPSGTATLAPMLEKTMPAVVNIAARAKVDVPQVPDVPDPFGDPFFNDPMFKRFFRDFQFNGNGDSAPPQQREVQGIGSGVIFDAKNGYILTNHHVVKNAEEIYVITDDKRRLDAKVVGSDPETDIAVLKVDEDGLTEIPLGDSGSLKIGDYVVAIGNPFGLSHTVTSGIVSALGRSGLGIEGYEDFIQTDAAINPGNSGGALVNLQGELVGINTAIFSRSGGSMGIGFAIPVNMARNVMEQIVAHGEVSRGKLGIQIQDLSPDIASALSIDVLKGALVADVMKGSPAEKAGIESGDVILRFDGEEVRGSADLKNKVGMTPLGKKVEIEMSRDGKAVKKSVAIRKYDFPDEDGNGSSTGIALLDGARFAPIRKDHPLFGEEKGVQVTGVDTGSPAWRANLREGDIITSVNQKAVSTVEELTKAASSKEHEILLRVRRGSGAMFIVVKDK